MLGSFPWRCPTEPRPCLCLRRLMAWTCVSSACMCRSIPLTAPHPTQGVCVCAYVCTYVHAAILTSVVMCVCVWRTGIRLYICMYLCTCVHVCMLCHVYLAFCVMYVAPVSTPILPLPSLAPPPLPPLPALPPGVCISPTWTVYTSSSPRNTGLSSTTRSSLVTWNL